MKKQIGNFDKALSNTYADVAKADYYSMFTESIFHYIEDEELAKKRILDIGCGNGNLCEQFVSLGAQHATGIDISQDQIRLARQRLPSPTYRFDIVDAYQKFEIHQRFEIVSCIYALHFAKNYEELKQACLNIYNHLVQDGIAVILDITHDYIYNKRLMAELKELTMYEYIPEVPEGTIPKAWSLIKGLVHTPKGLLSIDHIAIHGKNLIKVLSEVGFQSIERKSFVHSNKHYLTLWGEQGFNHHLLYCRK